MSSTYAYSLSRTKQQQQQMDDTQTTTKTTTTEVIDYLQDRLGLTKDEINSLSIDLVDLADNYENLGPTIDILQQHLKKVDLKRIILKNPKLLLMADIEERIRWLKDTLNLSVKQVSTV